MGRYNAKIHTYPTHTHTNIHIYILTYSGFHVSRGLYALHWNLAQRFLFHIVHPTLLIGGLRNELKSNKALLITMDSSVMPK